MIGKFKKWFRRIAWFSVIFPAVLLIFAYLSKTPTSSRPFPQNLIDTGSSPAPDQVALLVDQDEFWPRLRKDILSAEHYVYVQAMSFEADSTGYALVNALRQNERIDRRIIADEYSLYDSSDKFVLQPQYWFDAELKQEIAATRQLGARLGREGIGFRWVNPISPTFKNFPARNHKKLIVIDDRIAYLGGFNFSDHNFSWHDLMLRIEHPEIAKMLRTDFLGTWEGINYRGQIDFGSFKFYFFDGVENPQIFSDIITILEQARRQIIVESAYLSFPFFKILNRAKQRGVQVTIIAPEHNNKPVVGENIKWECARKGLELQLYQNGMSHLKALLVDGHTLVLGSGNYDFFHYTLENENAVVVTDSAVVSRFKEKVLMPDINSSRPFRGEASHWKGFVRSALMKTGAYFLLALNR